MTILSVLLGILLAGSLVYCLLILLATQRYLSVPRPPVGKTRPMSVLKPLYGQDEGLEENIRSFFEQNYSSFEILFAVHRADDPAVAVVEKLQREYAGRSESRLIVTGESPIPNAKAHSLQLLVAEARHGLLAMSDSDVRVTPDFLKHLAGEFEEPNVGLVTCPYRAAAGHSLWSRLEAIGMNTEFLGGVLVSRLLEKMKFALGPTLAVRRDVLEEMGGFEYLRDFLAEDFVMGQRAAQLGYEVVLSSYVVEHRIGSQPMRKNIGHRLRWARSTRRSRPAGYWGQIFTYPLPIALLFCAVQANAWPAGAVTIILRSLAAWATAARVLHDPLTREQWWLLPLQDVLGFLIWIGGFWGNRIVWRDRKCTLLQDGRLQINP